MGGLGFPLEEEPIALIDGLDAGRGGGKEWNWISDQGLSNLVNGGTTDLHGNKWRNEFGAGNQELGLGPGTSQSHHKTLLQISDSLRGGSMHFFTCLPHSSQPQVLTNNRHLKNAKTLLANALIPENCKWYPDNLSFISSLNYHQATSSPFCASEC